MTADRRRAEFDGMVGVPIASCRALLSAKRGGEKEQRKANRTRTFPHHMLTTYHPHESFWPKNEVIGKYDKPWGGDWRSCSSGFGTICAIIASYL